MQATGTLRRSGVSKGFILVVIAMLCALLLGAAGGYAARNVSPAAGASTHTQPALPTAATAQPTNQAQPEFGPLP